jgi:hypothetical protein
VQNLYFLMADMKKQAFTLSFASKLVVLAAHKLRHNIMTLKLNSMALVRERTIPTEQPPPVGEVSANFCG